MTEVIDFRSFIRNDWRAASVYKTKVSPITLNYAYLGSFSFDLTFTLLTIAIALIGAVIAEQKLVANGHIESARLVHYGTKAMLFGTFAFYLIRLTIRSIAYFL